MSVLNKRRSAKGKVCIQRPSTSLTLSAWLTAGNPSDDDLERLSHLAPNGGVGPGIEQLRSVIARFDRHTHPTPITVRFTQMTYAPSTWDRSSSLRIATTSQLASPLLRVPRGSPICRTSSAGL